MRLIKRAALTAFMISSLSTAGFAAAAENYNSSNWTGTFISGGVQITHTPQFVMISCMSVEKLDFDASSSLFGWEPGTQGFISAAMSARQFYDALQETNAKVTHVEPKALRAHLGL